MQSDVAGWLATQVYLRDSTPTATIVPRGEQLARTIVLLEELASYSLPTSDELRPGAVIGEGGMGIVREAEQVALGRTVAIKTLKPSRRDPASARDLLHEAWVAGSLEHPNVVPVHHLGVDDDGMPVLVLKRVEGVEWSRLIDDGTEVALRFGVTDLLAWNLGILLQVLNALRFAHSRGIIHRDLKPSNVMVGDYGEVYLLDWGVAVSLRDDGSGRLPLASLATQIAGTPCYMAPEMLHVGGDVGLIKDQPYVPLSERTDVYLAGAVLFELMAGRPPHEGDTIVEVITSVLSSRPELPLDAPLELAAICMRAMEPDPDDRYASIDALRLALQRYLEHRGSDQILARARARLDELARLLVTTPTDRARHREEIYRLLGECRFGFHEALASWRDNTEARRGLERATIAVAEYELATGDAATAVTLLSELDESLPLFARARAAAADQASHRAHLESISRAHDLAIGRRSRGWLSFTLGIVFTLSPLVAAYRDASHRTLLLASLAITIVAGLWIHAGRETFTQTLVSRRLTLTLGFLFIAQSLLVVGTWMIDMPPLWVHLVMLFLYFVVSGLAAITIDHYLIPTPIAFAIAFLVATRYPEWWTYANSAAALVFTINVAWAWGLFGRDNAKTT
jgi:eukaryotic-like serine/threonine-protein kinase